MNISEKDSRILRGLAERVRDIANMPEQETKRQMWFRHNRLERGKPMVLIFPEGSWGELLSDKDLETGSDFLPELRIAPATPYISMGAYAG